MLGIQLDTIIGDFVYAKSRLTGLSVGRASANAIKAEDRYSGKEKSPAHYDQFASDVNSDAKRHTSKLFYWFVVKDWHK